MVEGESTKEEEVFSLAAEFATWSTTLEGEATSNSREKRPRQSPSDEGAQKDWAVVLAESLNKASND